MDFYFFAWIVLSGMYLRISETEQSRNMHKSLIVVVLRGLLCLSLAMVELLILYLVMRV